MLMWIVIVVIAVAVVAVIVVAWWQRKNLRKVLRLEIRNLGNVPSRYELKAEDPHGALVFQFALDGDALPPRTVSATSVPVQVPAQERAPAATGPSDVQQVQQKARQAMGFSGAIADLLGSLGMMLPRSIGAPLSQAASQLRRGESRVQQVQRAPGRLKGQVGRVTRVKPVSTQKSTARPAPAPAARQAAPAAVQLTTVEPWVETPAIEPGRSLKLELLVKPARPRSSQVYSFAVVSRSVELEDAPEITEEWSGQITGLSGFRRYHPYFLIVAMAVFMILLAFWLANLGVLS